MMSIPEAQVLEELIWLWRSMHERVTALEERYPTYASGYLPQADIAARLGRLDRAAAATGGNAGALPADPVAGVRQPNKKRPPPGALRAAIATIVQSDPEATGPRVIEALRASFAGTPPSPRTVRWHLAALRGNGRGNGNTV